MSRIIDSKINQAFRSGNVQFAALFGSRANGTARANSDYDFLVQYHSSFKYTIFDLLDLRAKLFKVLKKPVDVVTLNGLNPKMKKEVHKSMKIIYGRK